jgi:hypothetical protein
MSPSRVAIGEGQLVGERREFVIEFKRALKLVVAGGNDEEDDLDAGMQLVGMLRPSTLLGA